MSQAVVEAIDQNLLVVSFVEEESFSWENHSMMMMIVVVVDQFFHGKNVSSLIRNFLYLISMNHFRENVEVNSLQRHSVEDDCNKKHVEGILSYCFVDDEQVILVTEDRTTMETRLMSC